MLYTNSVRSEAELRADVNRLIVAHGVGQVQGQQFRIRLRIAVKDDAKHPGGVNIFGRGFGNYDQDIVLRIKT